jgi:hypothetical protein
MGITSDNTELGMILPMRGMLSLVEYYEIIIGEFGDGIFDNIPDKLCIDKQCDAVIFSADVTDSGNHFYFDDCETDSLIFSSSGLGTEEDYKKSLIFIDQGDSICMFFSEFKYLFKGRHYFDMPRLIYRRVSRGAKRVRLDGVITLRKADGVEIVGQLYDFSPTGAGFFVPKDVLRIGENILAEFTIDGCGKCETVVNVVRISTVGIPYGRCLVGIKMSLTRDQKNRAEQLYLCKKADEIRRLPDYATNTKIHR